MSRTFFAFSAVFLLSVPAAALADAYPVVPAPLPPGAPAAPPTLVQIFHWLDRDHDGYLSLDEFLAAPWVKNKAQAARFFYWMGTNKDGLVSLREFLAAYRLYSGPSGYTIRVAYPWAWCYWRPWRYGWYWHGGWQHGAGYGYAVAGRGRAGHGRAVQVRRPAKQPGRAVRPRPAKHPKPHAKHVQTHKPAKAKHAGHAKSRGKAHGKAGGHGGKHR